MTDKKVKLCELCKEQPATVLCAECSKCYCNECSEFVHSRNSLKGHKTEAIPEGVIVDARCPLHSDALRMFCIDEIKLCCGICKVENLHDGNNTVRISDISQDNEVFSASEVRKRFADVLKCDDELDRKIEETIESIRKEGNEAIEKVKQTFKEAHDKLTEEETKIMEELEMVCNESEEVLQKNLSKLREVRECSKTLNEADIEIRGKECSRLMELNIVCSMEEQRRTMEKLHRKMMTDLKIGWDSEERKLSFIRTLFNGAPIPNNITFPSVLSQAVSVSWTCDENKLGEEDKKKVKYVVEVKKGVEEERGWKEVYSGTENKCSASGLDKDTEYNVRVKCVIGELQGGWSDVASAKTIKVSSISNIFFPVIFSQEIEITWDCNLSWAEEEDKKNVKYVVELKNGPNIEWRTYPKKNNYIISGLNRDTEYNIRVKCVIGEAQEEWSDIMKVKTQKKFNLKNDSSIMSQERNKETFSEKLSKWCGTSDFELLYRGTRDGFGASDFHRACDNKGKTLVLIKNASGHVFGGFASIPWSKPSSDTPKQAPGSFIFTLTNMHGIQPTKFNLKDENDVHAVYHCVDRSLVFGDGSGLWIYSGCNSNNNSNATFSVYRDTTGKGSSIFSSSTSTKYFKVQEIEVFMVNV